MSDEQGTDDGARTAVGDGAAMLVAVLLAHEMTELRMRLGLDPDGSGTIDRLLGKLGAYEAVSPALRPNGAAYDPSSRAARDSLRRALMRQGPVIARLARA